MFYRPLCCGVLIVMLLAGCAQAPPPAPTLEPVLPRLPTATAGQAAQPTATPIALGQASPVAPAPTRPATSPAASGPTVTPVTLEGSGGSVSNAQGATAGCLAGTGGTPRLPGVRAGVNIYLDDGSLDQTLDLASQLNAGWVRATLSWRQIEPQRGQYQWQALDRLADGASQRGLRVLLAIDTAPAWASADGRGGLPENPDDLATLLGALAGRSRGKVQAYEVWPNANTAAANGGSVAEPGQYVEALQASYAAIKRADPCALVLMGALYPTALRDPAQAIDDLVFYRQMLAYNNGAVRRAYDIQAVQLNTSGVPGKGKWPRESPAQSRGFYGHVEFVHDEMAAADEADRQIWVVSIGYRVRGEGAVAPEQQGEQLAELYPIAQKAYPWVSAIFVRDLALDQQASGERADFSLVEPDGAPRPGFARLRGAFGELRDSDSRAFRGTDLRLLWWYTPYNEPTSPLVVGPDGAIYTTISTGFVRGVDPNGAFRTLTRVAKRNVVGAALDGAGNIYATSSVGTIIGTSLGGELRWNELMPETAVQNLTVSPDGQTLFTGTERERLDAYATADGTRRWSLPLGGIPGQHALGPDGTIYVGSSDQAFHAIAPDGQARWRVPLGGWVAAPPLVAGEVIYGTTNTGAVFALNRDGSLRWRSELGAEGIGLARAADGTLYVTTGDSRLHALGADGSPRWSAPIDGGRPTWPAVGADGTVYLGAEDGGLRAFAPDGAQRGLFDMQRPIRYAPVAAPNGALYVARQADDAALVAFGPPALVEQYAVP